MDWKKELEGAINFFRKNGFEFMLVDASSEKGFNYPYLLYIPKKPRETMVMDCLNDYEENLHGMVENHVGIEEVYSLFHDEERIPYGANTTSEDAKQEDKDQTIKRMYYRMSYGMIALSRLANSFKNNAPAIVPLIPGLTSDEEFNVDKSSLGKDVIQDVAPQIKAIIEDAKRIIKEKRPEVELKEKIMAIGHSKSSKFANNFATYYPELCEAAVLLGREFCTFPIDEIALQIVNEDEISDNEQFQLLDGKVTKKITESDFSRIKQAYENEKRDYQAEITVNSNGTYNLPMNFPLGIADIDHYIDFSSYPGGKDAYKKALLNMPRMVAIGEQEETVPTHFAYSDGITLEGEKVTAGQNLTRLHQRLNRDLYEIEPGSMHNRVLEYTDATRILFGRSVNEKFKNFAQLGHLLEMPIQTKIYKGVGHAHYEYSSIIKELAGIKSQTIFSSKALAEDIGDYYEGVNSGNTVQIGDKDRAERVSPVPQLVRRFLVSKDYIEFKNKIKILQGITQEEFMKAIEKSFLEKLPEGTNQDRAMDNLTVEELFDIFSSIERESDKEEKSSEQGLNSTKLERLETEQENLINVYNNSKEALEQLKENKLQHSKGKIENEK